MNVELWVQIMTTGIRSIVPSIYFCESGQKIEGDRVGILGSVMRIHCP
jgi:hypothetical protein